MMAQVITKNNEITIQREQQGYERFLRKSMLPNIWCTGCGNGIVLQSVLRAVDNLGLDQDKVVVVSGIGCSSRASGYVDFGTLHTTHGRAIAFATGVKLANPELHVIVLTGDGDASAIGGNHLIHACRRNIDLTVVVFNNSIYGMTSGQASPMTPKGSYATTAPFGTIDRPFDLCKLAISAGATYVARGTAYHVMQLPKYVVKGLQNPGLSFIEVVTQCPTYYGRFNKIGSGVEMMKFQRDNAVSVKDAANILPEEMGTRFAVGELYNNPAPEYTAEYQRIIDNAMGGMEK